MPLSPEQKKELRDQQTSLLGLMRAHRISRAEAARRLNIPKRTPEQWARFNTLGFLDRERELKDKQGRGRPPPSEPVPPFPEFCRRFIPLPTGEPTILPRHHLEWLKAIEANDRVLILQPPEHGKTTFMENYAAWRIMKDPTVRIIYVSKTQTAAKKRLRRIASLLSDHAQYQRHDFPDPIRIWGPFRPGPHEKHLTWSKEQLYVSGSDAANRDPTVEALGVGNQIQGSRADIIILDDIATTSNQGSETVRQDQLTWIGSEVVSRLPPDGGLLVTIGTRVMEADIYSNLLATEEVEGNSLAKLVQSAILDDEKKLTLWPGHWPYEKLIRRRDDPLMQERTWLLTYQQQATGMPDAPFRPETIERCKDDGMPLGFNPGRHIVVMGYDPAWGSGTAALVVLAVDPATRVRYLLDCITDHPKTTDEVMNIMLEAARRYRAREVRIEKNNVQGYISHDPRIQGALAGVGCSITEEFSSQHNKYDLEWGIGSVAALMDSGLYRIPWAPSAQVRISPLLNELLSYRPGVKGIKKDRVDALWLAELSARNWEYRGMERPPEREVPKWIQKRATPVWARGKRRVGVR